MTQNKDRVVRLMVGVTLATLFAVAAIDLSVKPEPVTVVTRDEYSDYVEYMAEECKDLVMDYAASLPKDEAAKFSASYWELEHFICMQQNMATL